MQSLCESLFPEAQSKGDRAKAAILRAAVDEFGARGLEGARTRQIAQASGQNLGAIHYYFGSKEQLYGELINRVAQAVGERLRPVLESANNTIDSKSADAASLCEAAWKLLTVLVDTIIGHEDTLAVSMIMVREQMSPTDASEVIYREVLLPLHRCLTGLLAKNFHKSPDSPLVICRAHALLGQVMIFRAGRETICRRAGWDSIEAQQAQTILAAIRLNLECIFGHVLPKRAKGLRK